jgi:hypothetical protein
LLFIKVAGSDESSSIHRGIVAFVIHVRNGFFKRLLHADDRDLRQVLTWLDVPYQLFSFPLFFGFPVLGG